MAVTAPSLVACAPAGTSHPLYLRVRRVTDPAQLTASAAASREAAA